MRAYFQPLTEASEVECVAQCVADSECMRVECMHVDNTLVMCHTSCANKMDNIADNTDS